MTIHDVSLELNPFETKLLIALPEEQIFQESPQVGVVGPILKTQAAAVVQVGRLGMCADESIHSACGRLWRSSYLLLGVDSLALRFKHCHILDLPTWLTY